MQKIIELNLNELQAVTGGHKTVSASTTTTSQLSVSASTYSVSSDAKSTSSASVSFAGYRF